MAYIDIVSYITSWEMTELIIPFFIIFTVLLVAFEQVSLFQRRHSTILAICIALLGVSGHVMGLYDECWDIVHIISTSLPKVSLVLIAVVVGLAVLGIMGINRGALGNFPNLVGYALLAFVVYTFITSSECVDSWDIVNYIPDDLLAWILGIGIVGLGTWLIFRGGGGGGIPGGRRRSSDPYN